MLKLGKQFTSVLENTSMVERKTLFSFGLILSLNPCERSQFYLHGRDKEAICNNSSRVRCKNHSVKLHLLFIVRLYR